MATPRDPVEESAGGPEDLYGIATWEPRTRLDRVAAAVYRLITLASRVIVVGLALLILIGIGGLTALSDPEIGLLTVLSAIPALGLAAYVWYSDTTTNEPLSLLVGTFLLGVLTANFAAVVNGLLRPYFEGLAYLGLVLFFFLVVAPVEETVKLLAVRLYAYSDARFDAVIDGAVYGAMAGLGFAFIENSLYITQNLPSGELDVGLSLIGAGAGITAIRGIAGPGHVIYSAFAGYYLGLAKFNPENRGPIVIKGLLIAGFVHALYNTTAGIGTVLIQTGTGLPQIAALLVYVVIYDGFWGFVLFRKINRYRKAYRAARPGGAADTSRPDEVADASHPDEAADASHPEEAADGPRHDPENE